MRRTGPRKAAPEWFRLDRYAEAADLDAGDWLLNLAARAWCSEAHNPNAERFLRRWPVLRRNETSHRAVLALSDPPALVREALDAGRVASGIKPVSVSELYLFEKRLSADVRAFGASFDPERSGPPRLVLAPEAFRGRLDHAFGMTPDRQLTGRFVRVDLALPDEVLAADLLAWLKAERRELGTLGDLHYRQAAGLAMNRRKLSKLAALGLLPYLDLDRWNRHAGARYSFHALRELIEGDKGKDRLLRGYASIALDEMKLRAFFGILDRRAQRRPRRR
jgi:hypothetical protein